MFLLISILHIGLGPCQLIGYGNMCCPEGQDCQGVYSDGVCHCSYDCHEYGDCCIDVDLSCRCNHGDLRLVGGSTPYEGLVEICINNQWETICDVASGYVWRNIEASVACRQLGLSSDGKMALYT